MAQSSAPGRSADVAIVGGGVIGCAIAYALARRGADVVVVERSRVAAESSSAAAGILAPRVHATESGLFDLAMTSHRQFAGLVATIREDTGLDPEYTRSGVLDVAYDEGTAGALREKVSRLKSAGHEVAWLGPAQASAIEHGLSPEILGAFFDADAFHINPGRFTQSLGQAAARHGAQFQIGVEALGILRDGDRATAITTTAGTVSAGQVVLATGAWMTEAGRWIGGRIPVSPAKGQILTIYAIPSPIRTVVFGLDAYLLPRVDGTIVVGATVEEVGFDKSLTVQGLAWLFNIIPKLCPNLAGAQFDRAWTGLRPRSLDDLPIVGPAPGWENVTLAAGHFRNGIMLAPVTADLVTKLILDEQSDPLLEPLTPSRFTAA